MGLTFSGLFGTASEIITSGAPTAINLPQSLAGLKAYKLGDNVFTNIKPKDLWDASTITNTYYVDIDRPDDSGAGTSWSTAKKRIRAAIDAANASGLPSRIAVKGGVYKRADGFSPIGSDITLNVPMYIYSVHGRVTTGPFDHLNYTKTSGQTNVYQVTRSVVLNVLNPLLNKLYVRATSIADCDAKQGSFFTDNVTLYVHTHDSSAANQGNAWAILFTNNANIKGNHNIFVDGFDFIGGANGAFKCADGSTNTVIMSNCTAKYAASGTFAATTAQDGVTVLGCGIFAAFNSEASLNGKDGFNVHEQSGVKPFSLLVNCSGYENGIVSNSVSNNGYTVHDGCHSIDIGGKWIGSRGTNAGHVSDGTVVWSFGSVAGGSEGDTINGGTIGNGAFGVWSGAATYYLDYCTDISSSIGVNATQGATAYVREHSGTGSYSGNVLA